MTDRRAPPSPSFEMTTVITAVTLGVFSATVFFIVLLVIVKPGGFSASLARVNQRADRIEALQRARGDPYAYAPGALCRGSPAAAAADLQDRLEKTASGAGVTLASVSASPGQAEGPLGSLTPVAFAAEANGPYDAVLGFAGALAHSEPEIFLTNAELRSKTSQVSLKLNGQVFCSPDTRP